MAVIQVGEERNSPTGTIGVSGFEITRHFKVLTDSYADGVIVVCSQGAIDLGLPALYDSYDFGNEAFVPCRMRKYSRVERLEPNSLMWAVDCQYTTPENKAREVTHRDSGGGTGKDNPTDYANPLAETPTLKVWGIDKEVPLYSVLDYNNSTLVDDVWTPPPVLKFPCTSNCEIVSPPIMIKKATLGLSISRNEALSSPVVSLAGTYMNSVNADTFFGAAPGTMFCKTISFETQSKQIAGGNVNFLHTDYQFEFDGGGWDKRILDCGSYYFVGGNQSPNCSGSGSGVTGYPDWNANTTYYYGDVCYYAANNYECTLDGNQGNVPSINPAVWDDLGAATGSGSGAATSFCCGTRRKFKTDDGHDYTGLLDGHGNKLADGATPVFLTIQGIYPRLPFAALNLPQSVSAVQ